MIDSSDYLSFTFEPMLYCRGYGSKSIVAILAYNTAMNLGAEEIPSDYEFKGGLYELDITKKLKFPIDWTEQDRDNFVPIVVEQLTLDIERALLDADEES